MKNITFNIIFIRHAQTSYGEHNRFMGTLDVPCSEEGKKACIELRKSFEDEEFFKIYCSPLLRAIQTTELMFPNHTYISNQDLMERGLGTWAGKDLTTIKILFPEAFYESGIINPYYTPKDGEPIEHVFLRVNRYLKLLMDLYESIRLNSNNITEYNIAVVTHNGIIRVIHSLLNRLPISEIFKSSEQYLEPIRYRFNGSSWNFMSQYS